MNFKKLLLFTSVMIALQACKVQDYPSDSEPVTHEIWDSLVREHVTPQGLVDYKGFIQDSAKLNTYLDLLSQNHPNDKNWNRNERMAYWINAYNAFTVKLIIDNYPVASIKDIKNGIPFVNTVWDIKFIQIEGATYDLNNIEHGILRPKYKDPRIHMVLNCASISCPKLQTFAYTAAKLDDQMDLASREFINNEEKNMISPGKARLSKIFDWYGGDFDSVRGFVNKYSDVKINKDTKIEYQEYDWGLNDVK